jgi:uncharacterized membrane protein YesL
VYVLSQQQREFGQGSLFTFTNYVYWLFLTNFYFILANAIFIFFFMTLVPTFSNIIVYFLALIPSGPAITALCYSMDKLVRTKEVSPTRDFFYGYKSNIKGTFSVWLIILIVFFILIIDLQYFRNSPTEMGQILSIVIFILTILWTIISLNAMIINSKFKFRTRDVFKLAVYYSFRKFKSTIGGVLILFILGFLTTVTTDFLVIFVSSLVGYLMMLNSKEILSDIQENFLQTGSSEEIED